jgi:hypothetical protein
MEDRILLFATVSVWDLPPIQQALAAAFLKVMQLTCNFNHYPQVQKVKNYWNCTCLKKNKPHNMSCRKCTSANKPCT